MYKHDLICLSETYLDSTVPDSLPEIHEYNLIRADHPNNINRGGVCVYYKESLPVQVIGLTYFKEALLLIITDNNKNIIVSVIYFSPSQNNSEFDSFLSNLEQLLGDISKCIPIVSVITGGFDGRSLSLWSEDINNSKGTKLYLLISSNEFSQLINEPTRIQTNSSSSIDLVFTDQPNLSINSGVHAFLHRNCHHLNISYPPPHRLVWDYKKADSEKIRKTLDSVNWERLFNKKDIDAQVAVFDGTILNVLKRY